MSSIGNKIKLRRHEKGLSLTELARRANISKGYLHSIESGDTQNPSAEVLFRIANELGVTIADLLGQEEQKSVPQDVPDEEIPSTLKEFAHEEELPKTDVQMLARIEYRGKKPKTVEDWRYLFESIKRTVRED